MKSKLFVQALTAWLASVAGIIAVFVFGKGLMSGDTTALLAIFILSCLSAVFIGTSIYLIMAWAVSRAR